MTEEQQSKLTAERELLKSQACIRLQQSEDFKVFRTMLEDTKENYRTMLEERTEDNRSNILRGGILAIKDVLALFDTTAGREKSLLDFLEEIK